MQHTPLPIDESVLRDVVRQATSSDAAMINSWQVKRIAYHNVSPQSRGLYRVAGTAQHGDTIRSWSVVLKTSVAPPDAATNDPGALLYWRREALAYRSGLLPDLRGGLRAPRCWRVDEQPNGDVWTSSPTATCGYGLKTWA